MAQQFPTTSRITSPRGYVTLPSKPVKLPKSDNDWINDILDEVYGKVPETYPGGAPKTAEPPTQKAAPAQGFVRGKEYQAQPVSQALDNAITNARSNLNYDPEVLDRAMAGQKAKPFWQRALLGTLNYSVIKPLQTVDIGRRFIVSGIREGIDVFDPNRDASFKDFWKQLTDVNLSSKEVFNMNHNNKWVNNILGFALDIALDPTTYLTLGTGTAAKIALTQTTKAISGDVTQRILQQAAQDLATKSVKNVTDDVARQFAVELGEKATAKEIRIASRAAVSEAAQIAKQAGVRNADSLVNQAARRYSAVGPRRGVGAAKREATANALRATRDDAAREAVQFAGTAQGRRAQQFVDTITDDVIAKVATQGFSAIRGNIAKELGIKGGFRYNLPGVRASFGGGAFFTNPVGRVTSKIRRGVAGFEVGNKPLARFISPRGMSEAVWDARTGLRAGTFRTTDEAIDALELLSKDAQFRGFVNAGKQVLKPAKASLLSKGDSGIAKTVYQLLDPKVNLDAPLADIVAQVGRPVTQKEVDFAKQFIDFADELETAIGSTGAGITYRGQNRNWFPFMQTQNSYRFLGSAGKAGGTAARAREVLDNLGMNEAPLLGQTVDLGPGKKFFDTVLPEDPDEYIKLGIDDFNKMANDGGFKGEFFETNAVVALDKYIDKFARDYGFANMVSYNTRLAGRGMRPALLTGDPIAARLFGTEDILKSSTLDDVIAADRLAPWSADELAEGQRTIQSEAKKALDKATDDEVRKSITKVSNELDQVFRVLKESIDADDDIADAWAKLALDLQANYATLFSLPKDKVLKTITNVRPEQLRTVVRLAEDAFVALDSFVMPDARVRADLAKLFNNTSRLKDPKVANQAIEFWKGLQNSVKTWYTTSTAFHQRNIVSNWFQMIAGGGDIRYLKEGVAISNKWNKFLKEEAEQRGGLLRNPGELVQRFFEVENIPINQRPAAEEALLTFGAAGFGDLEDVFGGAASRAIGVTGREATGVVPLTRGRLQSEALRKTSTALGAPARLSRSVGDRVETQARFIFTYDAMRQGLTPDEAIARTSKFLVDYSDLSQLDTIARQFIPFWMWMSRNLPTQFVNMYTNPRLYQQYNSIRRNFEDKNGNNELLPPYLEKAGSVVLGQTSFIPGIGSVADALGVPAAITGRPDFGFPGAGQPSPLFEGIANPEQLLSSLSPALRNIIEQTLLDREVFGGQPLETPGQRVESAVEAAVPQLSFIQRALNPLFAGTDIPVIRDIPGIYSSTSASGTERESPDNLVKLNKALQFLFPFVSVQGPNERNFARRQQLERLGGASYQTQAERDAAIRNLEALQEELRRRLQQQGR